MDIILSTSENSIKRKELVCCLLNNRMKLILGQKSNYIKTIFFCDNKKSINYRLEKLQENNYNIYLDFNMLKNALQAGEGQKIMDETLLLIKKQIH